MTVQTAYNQTIDQGYPGLPYDLTDHNALGLAAEASSIRFGAAVVFGTEDDQARLPDSANALGAGASGLLFAGIVMREQIREQKPTILVSPVGDDFNYAEETETLSVKTAGRIYAICETVSNPGDPVYFRHAGVGLLGALRNAADGVNTQLIPNAKWLKTVSAGGLSVVDLG